MLLSQLPNLYVSYHEQKGRCVYCSEDIPKGSLIEICMLIILSAIDTMLIHETHLHDYYFDWEGEENGSAIALGYGSLYNHSSIPNAEVESVFEDKEIRILALTDIPAGEEITINYEGQTNDARSAIWFNVVE